VLASQHAHRLSSLELAREEGRYSFTLTTNELGYLIVLLMRYSDVRTACTLVTFKQGLRLAQGHKSRLRKHHETMSSSTRETSGVEAKSHIYWS